MKKIITFIIILFVVHNELHFCQQPDPLDFFPHSLNNTWQYRYVFTGEIAYTETFFDDSLDQDGNKFIWYQRHGLVQPGTGLYKIDTQYNLFQMFAQNDTNPPILYKLDADSGESWIYLQIPGEKITAEVVDVYSGTRFGKQVTIKKIEYIRHTGIGAFWFGNRYLATEFGLVRWESKLDDFYLAGAIIDSIQYGTITSVEINNQPQIQYDVIMNYPNPFNNSTIIFYKISQNSSVNITIYDLLGNIILTLVNEKLQKGNYEVSFEAKDVSSGIYLVVLKTDSNILTHKILLMK